VNNKINILFEIPREAKNYDVGNNNNTLTGGTNTIVITIILLECPLYRSQRLKAIN
jgi:hypothetical protein